jgi:hypothetical protein
MTTTLLIPPKARFFNASGQPLAGGFVYSYAAGTLTPKNTYTTYTGLVSNTNPVELDAAGEADIWLDGNYKISLHDANDVEIWTVDGVSSFSSGAVSEYVITTGSANNYIANPSPPISGYTAGQAFNVVFNVTNTGPSTINFSNLGTKAIVRPSANVLVGGELVAGIVYRLVYDGTNFQIQELIYNPTGPLSTITSATSTDLGTLSTKLVVITGTTTITSFGSTASLSNPFYFIRFSGVLILTHNGTSLIIPGATNITTASGDTAIVEYLGSGNWKVHEYTRLSALPLVTIPIASGGTGQITASTAFDALKQSSTDTYQGVIELATNSEALGGSDTTRAVTSAGLASSKSLSASGYMQFPGGLIIQWGSAAAWVFETDTTVTFPLAFPTACRSVSLNATIASQTQDTAVNLRSLSASNFVGTNGGGSNTNTGIYWLAIGY